MSNKKMHANAIIGKKMPVYLVGLEYDDFCDGGFEVFAVCDSPEEAKKNLQKARNTYPTVSPANFDIRTFEMNTFYET